MLLRESYSRKLQEPISAQSFEIEHFFIDFSIVIISQKLKQLFEENFEPVIFNETYLAQTLARQNFSDLDFFRQPTI